jgi:hypothetical protein
MSMVFVEDIADKHLEFEKGGEYFIVSLSSCLVVSTFIAQRIQNPMFGLSDRVVWFVPQ